MAEKQDIEKEFVHLARVALSERPEDVQKIIHRVARWKSTDPETSKSLNTLLRKKPTRSSPLRRANQAALPVDGDTRFQLLRVEENIELPHAPVYPASIQNLLSRVVEERSNIKALEAVALEPTKTILFTGDPGVGKTLAARWVARELGRPLLTLDLSAVMSSFLGRTGSNLRLVLDHAKSLDCVLLLDELDAIAKRRDDTGEIGELKRLVTVLLQQLDDWPSSGLLLAATNHAELLDPAVWRRFEEVIEFPLPSNEAASLFIEDKLHSHSSEAEKWAKILAVALAEESFSDIERKITGARRSAALNGRNLDEHLVGLIKSDTRSKQSNIDLAVELVKNKVVSQRYAHELTGVARDTIRERLKD